MLCRKWIYIGKGRNRIVWRRCNIVVKVPLNNDGLHDNWNERKMWSKYHTHTEIKYASCRLYANYFLLMEYVNAFVPTSDLPMWANYVDCRQVGYNRRGMIVAYDYGR